MAHTEPLTESQLRFVDDYRLRTEGGTLEVTYADLEFESDARHVDEYRHAEGHAEESP